jgi:GT2 family glycosyltransferase
LTPDVPNVPDVSIVIVSCNTREVLRECLETVDRERGSVSVEVIVVDNASRDGSADMVAASWPSAVLVRSDINLGFAAANNLAFARATGRYVVLLNSDAFLATGVLPGIVARMDREPHVGLAGVRLVGRDGSWQPSARMFPSMLNDLLSLSGLSVRYRESKFFGRMDRTWADPGVEAEVDWVPGAFGIIRRDVLEQVGYFDERFFLYYEEVDLCRRIKSGGHAIVYWPEFSVVHIGGESSRTVKRLSMSSAGSQLTLWRMRSALLYHRKHGGLLGAMTARLIESGWHQMRAARNAWKRGDDALAKAAESRAIASLLRQAWAETSGGRLSPPRPW